MANIEHGYVVSADKGVIVVILLVCGMLVLSHLTGIHSEKIAWLEDQALEHEKIKQQLYKEKIIQ